MASAHSNITRSPHPDVTIPHVTLPEFLLPTDTCDNIPIFYPDPTSPRLQSSTTENPVHTSNSLPLQHDTTAPLTILHIRDTAERLATSLLSAQQSVEEENSVKAKLRTVTDRVAAKLHIGDTSSSPEPARSHWQRGDVVAFLTANQHDFCAAVLGVQLAGGIPALCNPSYKAHELAHQLRMTKTSLIFATASTYATAQEAAQLASSQDSSIHAQDTSAPIPPPRILVFDEQHEANWVKHLLCPDRDAWEKRHSLFEKVRSTINIERDPAIYCFSSGTSGLPKTVTLTHRNIVANILQFHALMIDQFFPPLLAKNASLSVPPRDDDRSSAHHFHLDFLPQFHAYGLQCQFMALFTGTPRVVLGRFKLDTFLKVAQEKKVTFAFVVPPVLIALAKSPEVDNFDISSLKRVASGAATLSQQLSKQVRERLGIIVTDGYGMSEASPIVCLQNAHDAEDEPDSVGFLGPSTLARVVDGEGKDLPAGQEGELLLQGPQIMAGYLNNEEGNRASFTTDGDRWAPDCWLRTGDVAKVSAQGRISLTGRTKDIIKMHGFQVSPKELEDLLFAQDGVSDAAVVGVQDGEGGEMPWAFLVASHQAQDENESARSEAIIHAINGKVAGYKKIKGITWLDALPKSASGKVLKRDLKRPEDK